MRTLRETPPEGLMPWVQAQTDIHWEDYLIYRAGTWRNPLTEEKEKCVDAVCSACGKSMKLEYIAGPACAGYASAPFGFGWRDEAGAHESISFRELNCPCCGKKVVARHIGGIHDGISRYAWVMQPERDGEALILYFWRVQRMAKKDGSILWFVDPWEAYAFDAAGHEYFAHWAQVCYATSIQKKWDQRKIFKDSIYDIDIVYAPEGIERACVGTAMENSKLAEYMAINSEYRFPVTWLWIYQKHHNAENLLTANTAEITAKMIRWKKEEQLSYQQRCRWNTKCDVLPDLNWKAVRPWEILRVQKDEFSYFQDLKKDGEKHLAALILARRGGVAVKPGEEELKWLQGYEREFCRKGIDPNKVKRYIARQKRKYPKDKCSESAILDYLQMAKKIKWKLRDPEILWPQRFMTAHDEALRLWTIQRDEELRKMAAEKIARQTKKFEQRYAVMSKYSWEKDGITIRPARSEEELRIEGNQLHHCVHSYSDSHANGKLTIFFIRKKEMPNTPWFTLNFNEKELRVTMNLGLRNCQPTEEVKRFEKAWIAWVRKTFGKINEEPMKEVTAA